ncbi:MAG TPA: hypothetical protein PLA69_07670, partial [Flavobacterium sp.]|nr:hypothetical protein [Flavobacterium sp.]
FQAKKNGFVNAGIEQKIERDAVYINGNHDQIVDKFKWYDHPSLLIGKPESGLGNHRKRGKEQKKAID